MLGYAFMNKSEIVCKFIKTKSKVEINLKKSKVKIHCMVNGMPAIV